MDAFVGHLLSDTGPRHRVFPVVDVDGRPVGLVRVADLVRVPAAARASTTIRDVAHSLPAQGVVAADTPLPGLLPGLIGQLGAGGDGALVVADNRVVGIITTADLAHAVELGSARRTGRRC